MALTRLPGSKLWVETSDAGDFIAIYNKADIIADIAAIQQTLLSYPSPSQDATDVTSLLTVITNSAWNATVKARITSLINRMYQAYQGDQINLDAAQLIAKLDGLIALRERLV